MKTCSVIISVVFMYFPHLARASQADDTTITINGSTQGVTPFISNVHLTVSEPPSTVLRDPVHYPSKAGLSHATAFGAYANYYLVNRGFENPQTGEITLPVMGFMIDTPMRLR